MPTPVKFPSGSGRRLSGILHEATNGKPIAHAIFAHCFTCSKDIKAATIIARNLAARGISTLRFDFEGIGASEGDFADTSFSTNIGDLHSAYAYMAETYAAPQIMIGHSLGGTAVLAASQGLPDVKAVATIGSPASPDHILHVLEGHLEKLKAEGQAVVPLAGRPHTFKQDFVDDVMKHVADYSGLGKALMVMHAPFDQIVSIDEAAKIFTQAKHPKSFVSLDKADHLLTRREDAAYAANLLACWAENYIDSPPAEELKPAEEGVRVTGKTADMFYTTANAGRHQFIVDEPTSYGGTDLGPTPYHYLATALGSCTSMTLNMYARRKELAVNSVSVHVTHDRIHAEDCTDCEAKDGKVDRFIRRISIDGDLTDEQRARMIEIADRCPVHKTLENEIKIETLSA